MKNSKKMLACVLLTSLLSFCLVSCGEAGPAGATGATGETGAAGSDGQNGQDGTNGQDGKDGEDLTDPEPYGDPDGKEIKSKKFTSDYDSMDEVVSAGKELNKKITSEGYVLLKNEAGYLPIAKGSKLSVFGKSSGNISTALKNSGFNVNPTLQGFYADKAASGDGASSTKNASFRATGETPQSSYTSAVKDSYSSYNDTAVVVFRRTGGEGSDLPKVSFATTEGQSTACLAYPTRADIESGTWTPKGGMGRESDPFQHYLELDDNERGLLAALQSDANFGSVIVLLDSSYAMEVGFLNDEANYSKIKSALWLTGEGDRGFESIGEILDGTVNPSGRTPDILQSDFSADPSWQNFSNNFVGNEAGFDSGMGDEYTTSDGLIYKDYWDQAYYGVNYKEGIYTGYKYYETRGYTDGEEWYNKYVNYPFGYGLSYTDFQWDLAIPTPHDRTQLTQFGKIEVKVNVANTGKVAGKDVVQLYYSAPYLTGKVEKSEVELGDYAKTGLLQPGQSQTVTLSIDVRDMASYDTYDKNVNGFKGYELDGGYYDLYIGHNSHAWADANSQILSYSVPSTGFQYKTDDNTGNAVSNKFDYINSEMKDTLLSRADWDNTFPSRPLWYDVENESTIDPLWSAWYRIQHSGQNWSTLDTSVTPTYLKKGKAELVKDATWLSNLNMPLKDTTSGKSTNTMELAETYDTANELYGGGKAPWYSEKTVNFRNQSDIYTASNRAPIQLKDLMDVKSSDAKWDEFMKQYTEQQAIAQIITPFNFVEDKGLGMPVSAHGDGPFGIQRAFDLIAYLQAGDYMEADKLIRFASEVALASTFNKTLAYEYGQLNGDFGLWAHLSGWYSPGANIHRTPFSGRNNNYFSEDSILTGTMLFNVTRGCSDKGMITFSKHFALNDQETHRDVTGIATWADEQTIRQTYLKPFEMAAKEGNSLGMMTSFNRIGFEWTGASYKLLTQIARDEWGFKGVYITDAAGTSQASNYMNANMMIRAGQDISLDGVPGKYDMATDDGTPSVVTGINNNELANTSTHLNAIYNCTKRISYVVSRTAAMLNGYEHEARGYNTSASYLKYFFGAIKNTADIKVINATHDTSVNYSVADSDLTNVKYVHYSGDLLGLQLDRITGKLYGNIRSDVAAGTYRIAIGVTDSNIRKGEEWTVSDVNYFFITVA